MIFFVIYKKYNVNLERVGEILKQVRTELGYTRAYVAEKIGKKGSTIFQYEHTRIGLHIDLFLKMCELYNIDPCAVLTAAIDDKINFDISGDDVFLSNTANFYLYPGPSSLIDRSSDLRFIEIPILPRVDNHGLPFSGYILKGTELSPVAVPGSLLVFDNDTDIINEAIHLIQTKEGIFLRQVIKEDENLRLKGFQPAQLDKIITKKEVLKSLKLLKIVQRIDL